MPRIFLPDSSLVPGPFLIEGDKARYLRTVLRCEQGETITLSDNRGNSFSARVEDVSKKGVAVEVLSRHADIPESPLHITLMQGLLKGEKMDYVVQKATELGVNEIIPVVTERSQVRETRKLLRWKKIAEEASRQCGRGLIPEVREAADFIRLFEGLLPERGVIFWEEEGTELKRIMRDQGRTDRIRLLIGPEGGFSANEVDTARSGGFVMATLGMRTLRAETAAIAALSIVQYELGDLGSYG